MSDCYTPALEDFELSAEEIAVIAEAMKQKDPWDHEKNEPLKAIKQRILEFHLDRHDETCCYCREGLRGRGAFTTDREHILPKSKYKNLTYVLSNLSVACKRCNMEYKGDRIDFIVDPEKIESAHTNPDQYRFVHPNFDKWEDHLTRISCQVNTVEIVYFIADTAKGVYTSEFFRFDRYCIESLDLAQGIKRLDEKGQARLRRLAEAMGFELP